MKIAIAGGFLPVAGAYCTLVRTVDANTTTNIKKTNKIYIAPRILKRIRAQTHGVTRR